MRRFPYKLLALMLALLLGLSPFQAALAGMLASVERTGHAQQMGEGHHGAMAMAAEASVATDCEQCPSGTGCDGCGSGHCLSCLSALPCVFTFPAKPDLQFHFVRIDLGTVDRHAAALYRPPKA
jgi:hypothetical protein